MVLNTVSSASNKNKFRISWRCPALADKMNLLWMLLCCWACSSLGFVQTMEHCLTHRYQESMNSSHMQFTKEISSTEFAVLGSFKSLHCCAKGYRSIEWIKNGVPYPWPAETSSFILYPEAANQTIFTRQVQLSDIGNYSCVLRNDTHKKAHHISLEVQGNLPDMPLATFKPRDEIVELGNPARLYCEAFVGKVSLPDAKSEISWYQVFEGGLEQEIDGIQEQITREDGEIVGSYLRIPKVQLHNYGRYLCRIQIGDTSHRLDMYAFLYGSPIEAENNETLLLALAAAICAVFLVLIAWYLIVWCYRTNRKNRNQCRAMAKAELTSPPRRV